MIKNYLIKIYLKYNIFKFIHSLLFNFNKNFIIIHLLQLLNY